MSTKSLPLGRFRGAMIGTDINTAINFLKHGELVAIPTETVYGLAANAFDENAVLKIYHVKNRPQFNPLIIHTNSIEKLKSWDLVLPEKMLLLAAKYSPGPLTFVIKKSNTIPDIVTAGTDAVAVRIPNHILTLELLSKLDFPLAAPSANPSGFVSPTKASHVFEQLGDHIPYILDGGECEVGVESTIISFLDETPTILRFGGLSLESIESIIGKVNSVFSNQNSALPIAPGMLSRHYATKHKLIFDFKETDFSQYHHDRIGMISYSKNYTSIPISNQMILSPERKLAEAARKLFSAMREIDEKDIDVIFAEKFPDLDLGRAINDRLKRASV
ncbi:MAG: L-threonylcarbamoyladenylate synthase [Bacteroidota bacterium]